MNGMDSLLSGRSSRKELSPWLKVYRFFKSPWFWGATGVIAGATVSSLTFKYLFIFAWLVCCVGLWEQKFFNELDSWPKTIVGNFIIAVVCGCLFIRLWDFVPKPTEPPSLDQASNVFLNAFAHKFPWLSTPPRQGSTPTGSPPAKPYKKNPAIIEEIAKRMISLSDDVSTFAKDQSKIEEQLPAVPDLGQMGKGDRARYAQSSEADQWNRYHTKTRIAFNAKGYVERCKLILDSLSYELPDEDVSDLRNKCANEWPIDAKESQLFCDLLNKKAQQIEVVVTN
jgi:hypothetical protein